MYTGPGGVTLRSFDRPRRSIVGKDGLRQSNLYRCRITEGIVCGCSFEASMRNDEEAREILFISKGKAGGLLMC